MQQSHEKLKMSVISGISVIIACLEDPTFDVRINNGFIDYDSERHEFSLNRPIGDDWGQYIRHIPQPLPVLVRIEKRIIFILFAALNDAIALEKWLKDAIAEQEHGFSTMRG
ncbi:hypothetical protein [Acinetobacter johnsonii]|jgi:hypothetical protein|uniref:hypothetical protein n=1 Tax=Acinetobacter johnsonii TaxID=40214 RepID=UPI001917E231|nr:hypothetical protein [Acinetobacter johnsonii]MDO0889250.1 hypothetical protein [Acinetobacter pittii]QQT94942.1 hypothetical protein I6I51_17060 [Acinetobacter johnsonii]